MNKNIINFSSGLIAIALLILGIHLQSCDGDDSNISEKERALGQLTTGIWTLESATVDGVDKTSIYSGLKLKFSSNSYTAQDGGALWAANGTWDFEAESTNIIVRDDGLRIAVTKMTVDTLEISFIWNSTTYGSGRSSSITGMHVMTFVKR
jgi:hypothetical protein